MTPLNSSPQAKQTPTSMDTPSLIERLNETERYWTKRVILAPSGNAVFVNERDILNLREAIKSLTQLTEERDEQDRITLMAVLEAHDEIRRLRAVVGELCVDLALIAPDDGYKALKSWIAARALLTEDRPAEPTCGCVCHATGNAATHAHICCDRPAEPVIPATGDHPAIYRDGHRLTANRPDRPAEPTLYDRVHPLPRNRAHSAECGGQVAGSPCICGVGFPGRPAEPTLQDDEELGSADDWPDDR